VRQLFAVLEAAAIHADFQRIEAQHLPPELRAASGRSSIGDTSAAMRDARYRVNADATAERAIIKAALDEIDGALARTAELLGMGRTTLWRKLKGYGLAVSSDASAGPEGLPS